MSNPLLEIGIGVAFLVIGLIVHILRAPGKKQDIMQGILNRFYGENRTRSIYICDVINGARGFDTKGKFSIPYNGVLRYNGKNDTRYVQITAELLEEDSLNVKMTTTPQIFTVPKGELTCES